METKTANPRSVRRKRHPRLDQGATGLGQEVLVGSGPGWQCRSLARADHRGRLNAQHPLTAVTAELELSSWLPPEQTLPDAFASGTKDARGADWRGQSFRATDFSGASLCRVDFRGCDLTHCNLEGADLRLARYDSATNWPEGFEVRNSGAVGPGAKLNGAFLNGTDLRGMDLRGASLMGTYLSGADLSGTLLDDVRLVGADLRHAVLRGARCQGARFGGCQLDYADCRGANLTNAGLEGVESIKGADFSLCIGLKEQLGVLLSRPYLELDCWNPMTRKNTREALESLS